MDRGEIWWADLPQPVGRRPVLIVTRSAGVAVRNQVVVAKVTTTKHGLRCEVPLTRAEGMPQDCLVNWDELMTVPKSRLVRMLITLTPQRIQEVNEALRFALELP